MHKVHALAWCVTTELRLKKFNWPVNFGWRNSKSITKWKIMHMPIHNASVHVPKELRTWTVPWSEYNQDLSCCWGSQKFPVNHEGGTCKWQNQLRIKAIIVDQLLQIPIWSLIINDDSKWSSSSAVRGHYGSNFLLRWSLWLKHLLKWTT
jgi:hypothetical protein